MFPLTRSELLGPEDEILVGHVPAVMPRTDVPQTSNFGDGVGSARVCSLARCFAHDGEACAAGHMDPARCPHLAPVDADVRAADRASEVLKSPASRRAALPAWIRAAASAPPADPARVTFEPVHPSMLARDSDRPAEVHIPPQEAPPAWPEPDRYAHPHVSRALDTGCPRAVEAALLDVEEGLVVGGPATVRGDVVPLVLLGKQEPAPDSPRILLPRIAFDDERDAATAPPEQPAKPPTWDDPEEQLPPAWDDGTDDEDTSGGEGGAPP